jgi:hypothetical protein
MNQNHCLEIENRTRWVKIEVSQLNARARKIKEYTRC